MSSLEISFFLQYLIIIFLVSAVLKICIYLTHYVIWSRKLSSEIPTIKLRFFNILGHVSCLPLSKKSQNGFPLLIHLQQSLLGLPKLFIGVKLNVLWLFLYPGVILGKSEAVEAIFSSTGTIDKPWFIKWGGIVFGTGLVTSNGDKWRSRRRFLNAYFRKDIMKKYVGIIDEKSHILVGSLKKETREDFTKISKPISECMMNTMHEIVFGLHEDENPSEYRDFMNAVKWGLRFLAERMMNVFLWPDFIFYWTKRGRQLKKYGKTIKDFARSRIQKRKQEYLQGDFSARKTEENALIDLLLEYHLERTDFTENDVSDELVLLTIAGHDTTTAAVSWTLYMLGLYQEVQARVHEELDSIFGDDTEKRLTLQELNKIKYLKCVIKETLRLYPSIPFVPRQVHEDVKACGYQIPKGTTCVVFPYVLHRDEEVFPDAERFDPDRFLPENSQGRSPYAYIPFSAGPRNCIGQNLAMMIQISIISTLLRSYRLESLDPRDKVLPTFTQTITPSKPIRIRIRPRYSEPSTI